MISNRTYKMRLILSTANMNTRFLKVGYTAIKYIFERNNINYNKY